MRLLSRLTMMLLLVPGLGAQADPAYTDATLSGNFLGMDLFALKDGSGTVGWGLREYDGAGELLSGVTVASRTPLDYAVSGDGWFGLSKNSFNSGVVGSVGYGGGLTVYSPDMAPGADSELSSGYSALRISTPLASGYSNSDFNGQYSLHGLVFDGTSWWNQFGLSVANGSGTLQIFQNNAQTSSHTYSVSTTGSVDISGQAQTLASLIDAGEVLIQAARINGNVDSLYPGGYEGLWVHLKRSTSKSVAAQFVGTYHIHELSISDGAVGVAQIGSVTAGTTGQYFGDLGGNDFEGRFSFFESGVFQDENDGDLTGTMAPSGNLLVTTLNNGDFSQGTGEARICLWIRVAGGVPTPTDQDGDGVGDTEEAGQGTEVDDADSDDDGLLDNSDPNPTTPDNVVSLSLDEDSHEFIEGTENDLQLSLELDSNDFPFFTWTLEDNRSWLSLDAETGVGDTNVDVDVDLSDMTADESPYTATISMDAPGMTGDDEVTLEITVLPPLEGVQTDPESLSFVVVEGAGDPLPRELDIITPDDTDAPWEVESNQSWLQAVPDAGSGADTLLVSVDNDGLLSSASPYTGILTFSEDLPFAPDTDTQVTVEVLPSRGYGQFFELQAGTEPKDPAVAYDPGSNRYAILYIRSDDLWCEVLGDGGEPLFGPQQLSFSAQGVVESASVAVDTSRNVAWFVWAQEGSILGRELDLNTLTLSLVFGIAGDVEILEEPQLVYDALEDRFILAMLVVGDESSSVVLEYLDAATRDSMSTTTVIETDTTGGVFIRQDLALVLEASSGNLLLGWCEEGFSGVPIYSAWMCAVSNAKDVSVGTPVLLEDGLGIHAEVQLASVGNGIWESAWRATDGDEGFEAHRARLTPSGAKPVNEVGVIEVLGDVADRENNLAFSWADQAAQGWVAFGAAVEDEGTKGQRVTHGGNLLGEAGTLQPIEQYANALAYNPDLNELLLVWQGSVLEQQGEDVVKVRRLFAMRIPAGSSDQDNDGLDNDWEIEAGLDPLTDAGDDGADGDPDGDGLTNTQEQDLDTHPLDTDSDGDGLEDGQEDTIQNGVVEPEEGNPTLKDSDGDGAEDGAEWFLGTDLRDGNSLPDSGIVRVLYDDWTAGVTQTVVVQCHIAAAGVYSLQVNGAADPTINPPAGWSAIVTNGGLPLSGALDQGTVEFEMDITPPTTPDASDAQGVFIFQLTGNGVDHTRTLRFVVERHSPAAKDNLSDAEYALNFAPVLRFHRQESLYPIAVEHALALATLSPGEDVIIPRTPESLDLWQSPQEESVLDLPGETLTEVLEGYTEGDVQVYYTVAHLEDGSVEGGLPQGWMAIQYYLHYYADAWLSAGQEGHFHEGDWELVQVLLDDAGEPQRVTVTQQWNRAKAGSGNVGSASREWAAVEVLEDAHPVLYVGEGGHSLYFESGEQDYDGAVEWSDGLGLHLLPDDDLHVDYVNTVVYPLEDLGRPGEEDARPWLRFAGHWGQLDSSQGVVKGAGPLDDGPVGPLFMGTAQQVLSADSVYRFWDDPWALSQRSPVVVPPDCDVSAQFPVSFAGDLGVAQDVQGRVYAAEIGIDGAWSLTLPQATYVMGVMAQDIYGSRSPKNALQFQTDTELRLEAPLYDSVLNFGALTEQNNVLVSDDLYAALNLDEDAFQDDEDPDWDNDGILNVLDDDDLNDGFLDSYQIFDADEDGLPALFDDDDTVKEDGPADLDGDGVIDVLDLDLDNDGFSNRVEDAAGSSAVLFFDTPMRPIGDADGDNDFDVVDLQAAINRALHLEVYHPRLDFNADGRIDALDLEAAINRLLHIFL